MKSVIALAVTLSLLPVASALAGGAPTPQMRSAPPVAQKSVAQKSVGPSPSWKKKRHGHRHHGKGRRHRALPIIVEDRASAARAQAPAPDLKITGIVAARSAGSGPSYYSSWAAACEALHPGFDARTGSYIAQDGSRRRCD